MCVATSEGPTFWNTACVADWYSFSFCSRSILLASACSSDVFTFRRPCYRERQVGKVQTEALPSPPTEEPQVKRWYRPCRVGVVVHAQVRGWALGSHHDAGSGFRTRLEGLGDRGNRATWEERCLSSAPRPY